jgi:predicted DNA binding protein
MRQLTLVVEPNGTGFHPGDQRLAGDDEVTRVAIQQLRRLPDGMGIVLYRLRGTPERIDALLTEEPSVETVDISGVQNGYDVYIKFDADGLATQLFDILDEYDLLLDFPISCITDGGIRVRALGEESKIHDAVAVAPEEIQLELEEVGTYEGMAINDASLTERQQEIIKAAVEAGYYDIPRETSREALAEDLEISGGTVSEHLRKIESKIIFDYSDRVL